MIIILSNTEEFQQVDSIHQISASGVSSRSF